MLEVFHGASALRNVDQAVVRGALSLLLAVDEGCFCCLPSQSLLTAGKRGPGHGGACKARECV